MAKTFDSPQTTSSEEARLRTLDGYSILDTLSEQSFDDLTEIAAEICDVPIALVSFVAGDRQWFKSEKGLGVKETPRDLSFCAHTIKDKQTLIVPDAGQDPRFQSNSLVTGQPGIRFYAGAPIIETNGHVLGTVCVIDTQPRTLGPKQISALEALARQAVSLLEHRSLAVEKAEMAKEAIKAFQTSKQHEEKLQLAMDAADLGAWYYDPVRNIVGADRRIREMFGMSVDVEEAPAETWLAALYEEDRARVGEEFAASLTGAPFDSKYRVERDGECYWIHGRAKVTPMPDGTMRMIGICEDVTREETLARQLAKTSNFLELTHNVSGAVSFDWSLVNDSVHWGGNAYGRSPSQLLSAEAAFNCVLEEDREHSRAVVAEALKKKKEFYHEHRAYWPDGSLHWVSSAGKPMLDENGEVTSVVGVSLDITDRKISEEALLRSEKLAAVGRLVSTISHEINNPLEAVTNLLFLVRNSPDLSQADKDHLDIADRELARVTSATAQTLRFHRSPLNPTKIQVSALLNEALELYRSRLSGSSIEVVSKVTDASFTAFETDVRQVLNTLVRNAFDAMRQGGTLWLRASTGHSWRDNGSGVVITVADTGPGIDASLRTRVFEAFYSTKGIGGTGLGLWIAKRIVHKHKGHLSFRSRTGAHSGTVFRLWLPLEAAPSAREPWAE